MLTEISLSLFLFMKVYRSCSLQASTYQCACNLKFQITFDTSNTIDSVIFAHIQP